MKGNLLPPVICKQNWAIYTIVSENDSILCACWSQYHHNNQLIYFRESESILREINLLRNSSKISNNPDFYVSLSLSLDLNVQFKFTKKFCSFQFVEPSPLAAKYTTEEKRNEHEKSATIEYEIKKIFACYERILKNKLGKWKTERERENFKIEKSVTWP